MSLLQTRTAIRKLVNIVLEECVFNNVVQF